MGERTDEVRVPSGPDLDTGLAGEPLGTAAEDRSSDEIAAEIDQTRAEMSETVDELQRKLAPDRLVDDFLDTVRDSLDKNSERILDTMRQHPVVTSLIGLGVGWLLLQSTGRPATRTRDSAVGHYPNYGDYVEYPYEERPSVGERVSENAAGVKESLKAGVAAARDKAGQLAAGAREHTAHMAGRVREQASHAAGEAAGYAREQAGYVASRTREQAEYVAGRTREQAGYVAGRAREQMGYMGTAAADQARRAANRFGDMVYENPFAVAVVGLAVGAAIGLLIPETRKEDELMGETRDTLLDKAKATASNTMERVQRVAEAAKDAATDEAHRQNLSTESLSGHAGMAAELGKSLMDKAEDVVKSAADAAREEAKRQGLTAESSSSTEDLPGTTSASSTAAAAAKDDMRQEGCGD